MNSKNFDALSLTATMALFFGMAGCTLALRSLGMPLCGVAIGLGIAFAVTVYVGIRTNKPKEADDLDE